MVKGFMAAGQQGNLQLTIFYKRHNGIDHTNIMMGNIVKTTPCKFKQAVNQSLKGLNITAQGFNPGYRLNVNQSAVGATYSM